MFHDNFYSFLDFFYTTSFNFADPYPNPNPNPIPNPNPNPNRYSDLYPNPNSDPNLDPNPNSDPNLDPNPNPDLNPKLQPNPYSKPQLNLSPLLSRIIQPFAEAVDGFPCYVAGTYDLNLNFTIIFIFILFYNGYVSLLHSVSD